MMWLHCPESGRADIFIIVVHLPQKVKKFYPVWRNSPFSSKGGNKTAVFMGFLPDESIKFKILVDKPFSI